MEAKPPADNRNHVLIVDDDPDMRRMVSDYLRQNDMKVSVAAGQEDMLRQIAAAPVDLIVLDLRLGAEDGLDLLRTLRTRSTLPVIILTGHRREEVDRVIGLELGADDYLTKPFGMRELLARIRVVLRRLDVRDRPREPGHGSLRFGRWQLDLRRRCLYEAEDSLVPLTKGEYALLLAFLETPLQPLTREQLLQATRVHEDVFDRSIDVQILRLRRKLEDNPSAPRIIRTDRGVGYVFTLPVTRS